MLEICLPELGEGIEEATIACYHFAEGDSVQADEDVVEVVTDKATFNVPADQAGKISRLCFKEGDKAPIGAPLVIMEASGA